MTMREKIARALQERLTLWNAMRLAGDDPPPEGYADLADAVLAVMREPIIERLIEIHEDETRLTAERVMASELDEFYSELLDTPNA